MLKEENPKPDGWSKCKRKDLCIVKVYSEGVESLPYLATRKTEDLSNGSTRITFAQTVTRNLMIHVASMSLKDKLATLILLTLKMIPA